MGGDGDCSGYFCPGFGRPIEFSSVISYFKLKPGYFIQIMHNAAVVGRCGDCKHWSDVGEYNNDPAICTCEECSVGVAKYDFGCAMWESNIDHEWEYIGQEDK